MAFQFRRRGAKYDIQDDGHRGHFRFPIETTLALFHLKIVAILSTQFRVS